MSIDLNLIDCDLNLSKTQTQNQDIIYLIFIFYYFLIKIQYEIYKINFLSTIKTGFISSIFIYTPTLKRR